MPHVDFIGPDGKKWPSATELTALIPKAFLWAWYKRSVQKNGWQGWLNCNKASEDGKRIGSLVHYYLECLTQKQTPEVNDEGNAQAIAQSLYEAVNPIVEEYVAIEPHLISNELRIHGTADIIVKRDGKLWIGDYKTSYQKDKSHPIQLAIYSLCWNEEHPDQKVDDGFIARVDKKSARFNAKIDDYCNLSQYYPVIRSLKNLWDYTEGDLNV